MSREPGGIVRLRWSARESFSADVPEQRPTALRDLDPILLPDGRVDLDALSAGDVSAASLDSLLAELEAPVHSDGVQEREIDEAYRLDVAAPQDESGVSGCSCEMADPGVPGHDQGGPLLLGTRGRLRDVTADVRCDDRGRPFADTVLTLASGEQITVTVHLSLIYRDTINIEIDGDFTADRPSLRVHLNDCLIHDSIRNDPPLADPRDPDLCPDGTPQEAHR